MGNVIQIKRGKGVPARGVLKPYELGIDKDSGTLYYGKEDETAAPIAGGGGGGSGMPGAPGATFTPAVSEEGVISWTNNGGLENPDPISIKGPKGDAGAPGGRGDPGEDGKSAYAYAQDGGYTGTATQFANKLAETPYKVSVKEYGAKGNGSADDTKAFQEALAANRVVYVPGGEYKLSDTIRIGDNCELELSQDAVLKFTQTDKHGVEMQRLANLRGNHATIFVPYAFTKNVIHAATDVDSAGGNNSNVPPFTTWDPQWKYSRYVTDINICKKDSAGFCYSTYGECSGTGLYIGCDVGDSPATYYMWGVSMSGVRIQGAFTNGIHVKNIGEAAWNHDMRLEAVIDACETGVLLERTNIAHMAVTFQPRASRLTVDGKTEGTKVKYAKWGIKLVDSKWVDLTQSTIWDWHLSLGAEKTADQSEYQHIAMYGDCTGLILGDFLYHIDSRDIRDIIYSENDIKYPGTRVSNLATMTILQEPITRWFKTVDHTPYFYDGATNQELLLREEFRKSFETELVPAFTNQLPLATDTDNTIFNGIGYKPNTRINFNSGLILDVNYYTTTGFIPCSRGDIIYMSNVSFKDLDGWTGIYVYDNVYNPISGINAGAFSADWAAGYLTYTHDNNNNCSITLKKPNAWSNMAYVRFCFVTKDILANMVISVNEPIAYNQIGALAETVKVTDKNIESTRLNTLAKRVDEFSKNIPTDEHINNLINVALGVIENGSY